MIQRELSRTRNTRGERTVRAQRYALRMDKVEGTTSIMLAKCPVRFLETRKHVRQRRDAKGKRVSASESTMKMKSTRGSRVWLTWIQVEANQYPACLPACLPANQPAWLKSWLAPCVLLCSFRSYPSNRILLPLLKYDSCPFPLIWYAYNPSWERKATRPSSSPELTELTDRINIQCAFVRTSN